MSNDIKCCKCGRFIAYRDIDEGKAHGIDRWDHHNKDLVGVDYICPKCVNKEIENYQKGRGEKSQN